jgi:hypothetical protein
MLCCAAAVLRGHHKRGLFGSDQSCGRRHLVHIKTGNGEDICELLVVAGVEAEEYIGLSLLSLPKCF